MRFDPTTGRYMPVGEPLPWRNTFLSTSHSVSAYTLLKGAQLSYNPTYWQSYALFPRWNFTDTLSVRLNQGMALELTPSEAATKKRQLLLGDTTIDLVEANLETLHGVIIGVGARLLLPLSIASRARKRVMATGLRAALTKSIKGVAEGLVVQLMGAYSRWWARSNVASVDPRLEYPCSLATPVGLPLQRSCDQALGPSSIRDVFVSGVGSQVMLMPGWIVSGGFSWIWALGYGLSDASVPTLAGDVILSDQSRTHWRNATSFSVSTTYMAAAWVMLTLAFGSPPMGDSQLKPDGSRRNPFVNRFSQLSLAATVTLDQLYTALRSE